MSRINHPSQVVSVGDIITVYVYEIDEARGRVSLSLLPLDKLNQREKPRPAGNNKKNRKPEKKPQPQPKKPEITMEDATRRLLERFGK